MPLTVTPIYAALLAFVFLALITRVITYRKTHLISLGDNDDKALRKRMRAHANFVEYTPLGMFLLLIAELQGAPAAALHLMGLCLLGGRVLHAVGFSLTPQKIILRQIGILLNVMMIAATSIALLGHALL